MSSVTQTDMPRGQRDPVGPRLGSLFGNTNEQIAIAVAEERRCTNRQGGQRNCAPIVVFGLA